MDTAAVAGLWLAKDGREFGELKFNHETLAASGAAYGGQAHETHEKGEEGNEGWAG